MARLLDAFSAFFAFGLRLADARSEAGGAVTDPVAARQQARALLDARARAAARGRLAGRAGRVGELRGGGLVRRTPAHGQPARPMPATPCRSTLFNSSNAQTEFFHHLAALGPDDGAVREVYWYALALGFRGQYYFEDADTGEWGKLKRLHGQQLPTPVELDALAWTRLTPQPYASPDPPARRRPQRRRRALVKAAGAVALLAPAAYLISLLLGDRAGPPPAPAERVAAQLQRYACADLALATGADGSAHVSGFVASSEDGARVRQDIAALPQAKTPDFDLRIRAWPYCEVAAILKPYQLRNQDSKAGLRIEAPSAPSGPAARRRRGAAAGHRARLRQPRAGRLLHQPMARCCT